MSVGQRNGRGRLDRARPGPVEPLSLEYESHRGGRGIASAAARYAPMGEMLHFPLMLPEEPKPPSKWPRRLLLLLLTVAAAVGVWAIVTYLVMPWISEPDTTTGFEDRLTIHPHEVVASHPTSQAVATYKEKPARVIPTPLPALPITTPTSLPASTTLNIKPKPTSITSARKPRAIVAGSGRYYMFLPPFLHGAPDTNAPFYRWTQNDEFNSAANCERFRQQAISDTVDDRDQDTTKFKSLYDNRIKLLTAASCVSARDPRMKEVQ